MSKARARYVGPYEEVVIWWPPGATVPEQTWTVKQNHWLPDDAPAVLRDELLAGPDWDEVERSTATAKKDDK